MNIMIYRPPRERVSLRTKKPRHEAGVKKEPYRQSYPTVEINRVVDGLIRKLLFRTFFRRWGCVAIALRTHVRGLDQDFLCYGLPCNTYRRRTHTHSYSPVVDYENAGTRLSGPTSVSGHRALFFRVIFRSQVDADASANVRGAPGQPDPEGFGLKIKSMHAG